MTAARWCGSRTTACMFGIYSRDGAAPIVDSRRHRSFWGGSRIMITHSHRLLMVSLAAATFPAMTWAQDITLEEVIVTAQKREQKLIDVPVAITAMSGTELEQRGLSSVQDISFAVPGLTMREDGPGSYHDLHARLEQSVRQRCARRRVSRRSAAVAERLRPARFARHGSAARRSAQGTAGHALRPGLGRRRHPLHHQRAAARRVRAARSKRRRSFITTATARRR